MANVLVRDLPDYVHAALLQRAASQGQSLQQFLSIELRRLAEQPSLGDVLDRIEQRSGGRVGLARAVDDLHDGRGER